MLNNYVLTYFALLPNRLSFLFGVAISLPFLLSDFLSVFLGGETVLSFKSTSKS